MKSTTLLLGTAGLLALALPCSLQAKKPGKNGARSGVNQVLGPFDKNSNGLIDGDEVEAVKKAYAADPSGPLKHFDTNSDGKLDENEIAAIQAPKKKKKKN